ncbi:hypothetical protein ACP4OV_007712 [Aristida adscensionis]
MARHRQPVLSSPSLALAVMAAVVCAASTAAQQLPQPPPQPLPLPQAPGAPATVPQAQPGALPTVPAACPPAQATLSPCFNDLFGGGNSSSPSAECCSQIQAMFQSQAPCLCAAMASAPFQLGSTLGQLIPSSCNLPPNACSGGSAAPAGQSTPASGTTAGPAGVDPTAPAGGGLKSVPAMVGSAAAAGYSGISAAAVSIWVLIGFLF